MSLPARIVTLLVAFAAVVVGAVFLVVNYVADSPPTVRYTASGGVVNVMLQEDPGNSDPNNPDWVSYYVQDPGTKQWVHTTLFSVPAHTTVHVTILGYDGCTPLRNNFFSQIQGTAGNKVTVQQFANTNKPAGAPQTVSTINSWSSCAVGHTFAIPRLGLFVPVASPTSAMWNANNGGNQCSSYPCTAGAHTVETFDFTSPSAAGVFRWQCFVPCGGGFIDGNGGPMGAIGYMMGEMEVSA